MKITEHIHALKIPFQIPGPHGKHLDRYVYLYVILGEKIYLIDSGVSSTEEVIYNYIKDQGRKIEDVAWIFLTHSHPDHIGSAAGIKEKTGCRVAAHAAEKHWIEDVDLQAQQRPVPGFHDLVKGSVAIDKILVDDERIDLEEGIALQAVHTPGHSPGSVSFFLPQKKTVFSADAVPLSGSMPIYDDPVMYTESIRKLKTISDIAYLLSAWDEPRYGKDAYQSMNDGIAYLQAIHDTVLALSKTDIFEEPMELCRRFVEQSGLPHTMVNPLVARSLWSHYQLRDKTKL